eukprot:CAMPEP_0116071538 /NCGR_PEP_ID=MMETSP0322-20121206/13825_1 /TAXON_ID=163516 /ORGANISM="Leptocylindrus danicus var. apora, Strain B651" /LENGTH=70 /DNA_ID=CAMNT_0003559877 /DNA_START=189 /DNA_END=401 /DNA_ORIENTATION=+
MKTRLKEALLFVDTNKTSNDEVDARLGNPDDSTSNDSEHCNCVDGFDSSHDPSGIKLVHADDDMIKDDQY